MSAANIITATDTPVSRAAFEIPLDLTTRYQVRVVETPGSGERRVGMFRPGERTHPALEIANDQIVARNEDRETIASLVDLAEHNGWERINVEGSPTFRRAIWSAATRAQLTVKGYEPSFAESLRMKTLRREDAERGRHRAAKPPALPADDGAPHVGDAMEAIARAMQTDDTTAGAEAAPAVEPSPGVEERTIVERALERGICALEAHGDPRTGIMREAVSALVRQMYGPRQKPDAQPARKARPPVDPTGTPPERDALAALFLDGAAEAIAADPRLASALRAQTAMEQHIAEVFGDDAARMAAAKQQSRAMIADGLRRGLAVAVREPAPAGMPGEQHSDGSTA